VKDQFDVVKNNAASTKKNFPFLLVLQHPFLDELKTVVVVPIISSAGRKPIEKLALEIEIEEKKYFVLMYSLAAVDHTFLGPTIANLSSRRDEIIRAYDLIISGI
jgi:toxin CcdB